jgi:hypothetical protein
MIAVVVHAAADDDEETMEAVFVADASWQTVLGQNPKAVTSVRNNCSQPYRKAVVSTDSERKLVALALEDMAMEQRMKDSQRIELDYGSS